MSAVRSNSANRGRFMFRALCLSSSCAQVRSNEWICLLHAYIPLFPLSSAFRTASSLEMALVMGSRVSKTVRLASYPCDTRLVPRFAGKK